MLKPRTVWAVLVALCFPFLSFSSESDTDSIPAPEERVLIEKGLLWEISGNGLKEPSYMYGTMHVSSKLAFHLKDTFYYGIANADIIALESDPRDWNKENFSRYSSNDDYSYDRYWGSSWNSDYRSYSRNFYNNFTSNSTPEESRIKRFMRSKSYLENQYLYRSNMRNVEYEEKTYLDLFIFQAGRKQGKKALNLEDTEVTDSLYEKANEPVPGKKKKYSYNSYRSYGNEIEESYRDGDLNALDSLHDLMFSNENYRKYFLDERNFIMLNGIDSLIKKNKLFVAVGAAHLPGKNGLVNLLREKGYSLRPVQGKHTRYAEKAKKKINKMLVNLSYKTYTSGDKIMQVDFPDSLLESKTYKGITNYYHPDMENGGSFYIKRLKTNPVNSKLDEKHWLESIEKLLYENTKGDIVKKKNITQNGFQGIDVINKTRKGNWEATRYVVTPLEIFMFRVNGPKKWVQREMATFFKSIKLSNTSGFRKLNFNNRLFSLEGFDMSNYNVAYENEYHRSDYEIQMYHPKTNTFLEMYTEYNLDRYYIEEDTFELKQMIRSYVDDLDSANLDTIYLVEGREYPCAKAEGTNKRGEKMFLQTALVGMDYFLFSSTGDKEASNKVFDSFKTNYNFQPDSFFTYTDSTLCFKVRTPINPGVSKKKRRRRKRSYSYYSKKRKRRRLSYSKRTARFRDGKYRDQIKVNLTYLQSVSDTDSTSIVQLLAYRKDTAYGNKNLIVKKWEVFNDTTIELYWTSSDTGSYKINRSKGIINKDKLYYITTTYDSTNYNKAFVDTFFNSFQVFDTIVTKKEEAPNQKLLDELLSGDSAKVVDAANEIRYEELKEEFSSKYIKLLRDTLPRIYDEKDSTKLISSLHRKLGKLGTDEVLTYFEERYNEEDQEDKEKSYILRNILRGKNDNAFKLAVKLLDENPPYGKKNTRRFFKYFADSLELAAKHLPKLNTLIGYPEYTNKVYKLTAILLDSNLIDKKFLKTRKNKIIRDVDYFFKHDKAESQSSYYSKEYKGLKSLLGTKKYKKNVWYMSNNEAMLKLLFKFKDDARVKKILKQQLKIKSLKNRVNIAILFKSNDIDFPDTLVNNLGKEKKHLFDVYYKLYKAEHLELLDTVYKNQFNIAYSFASKSYKYNYSWSSKKDDDEDKDTVEFVEKRTFKDAKDTFNVYFFKKKYKDEDKYKLIVIGYQPKDTTQFYCESKSVVKATYRSLEKDEIEEKIKEYMSELPFRYRKRMGIDHPRPKKKKYDWKTYRKKYGKIYKKESYDYYDYDSDNDYVYESELY